MSALAKGDAVVEVPPELQLHAHAVGEAPGWEGIGHAHVALAAQALAARAGGAAAAGARRDIDDWLVSEGSTSAPPPHPLWVEYSERYLPWLEEQTALVCFNCDAELFELHEDGLGDYARQFYAAGTLPTCGQADLGDARWAFGVVCSRAFGSRHDRGARAVPFADMMNSAPPASRNCTFEVNPETGWFVVSALRDVEAGEELFITYGDDKANWTMMDQYGFVYPGGNAKDETFLGRDAAGLPPIDASALYGTVMARRPPKGHGVRDENDPMVQVGAAYLQAAVLSLAPATEAAPPDPVEEARRATELLGAVEAELDRLPTTLAEDEAALDSELLVPPPGVRPHVFGAALRYRIERKRVLHAAATLLRAHAEVQLAQLALAPA